jgi:uncharacterized protein (DUF1778 family)
MRKGEVRLILEARRDRLGDASFRAVADALSQPLEPFLGLKESSHH